jgi:hypothetical protein
MLISSYGTPPTDPVSWNRRQDLLKSNLVYVDAPSVSLYMQYIKRFAGDHVASKQLLHDGPVNKTRGHFKDVYSADPLVEMESLQFVGCSWFIGLIGLVSDSPRINSSQLNYVRSHAPPLSPLAHT